MYESSYEESNDAVIAVLPAKPEVERKGTEKPKTKTKTEPNYHVIIWNDEDHGYDFVIAMLMKLFGHSHTKAYDITWEVDHKGKGIACTCHRELAELKCEQVEAYGPDRSFDDFAPVSMRATIEPAPE